MRNKSLNGSKDEDEVVYGTSTRKKPTKRTIDYPTKSSASESSINLLERKANDDCRGNLLYSNVSDYSMKEIKKIISNSTSTISHGFLDYT